MDDHPSVVKEKHLPLRISFSFISIIWHSSLHWGTKLSILKNKMGRGIYIRLAVDGYLLK
jgi:hypothetical protein